MFNSCFTFTLVMKILRRVLLKTSNKKILNGNIVNVMEIYINGIKCYWRMVNNVAISSVMVPK